MKTHDKPVVILKRHLRCAPSAQKSATRACPARQARTGAAARWIWGFHGGYPNSWLIYFMENPNLKFGWWLGYPYDFGTQPFSQRFSVSFDQGRCFMIWYDMGSDEVNTDNDGCMDSMNLEQFTGEPGLIHTATVEPLWILKRLIPSNDDRPLWTIDFTTTSTDLPGNSSRN